MNLRLQRRMYRQDGIFSELRDSNGALIAVALEHAYEREPGQFTPKIPNGTYTCIRGQHRLHGMVNDFTTFEVEPVPNCKGILFHWGNYNNDSDGCVLVGKTIAFADGIKMITRSRDAFALFMKLQEKVNSFTLTVQG